MTEPEASRPHMPGYGIAGPDEGRGLLPWTWAEDRLVRSHDYWLATVHPNGAPHVMPVWGVWEHDARVVQLQPSGAKSEKHRGRSAGRDHDGQPPAARGGGRRGAAVVGDDHDIERFTAWVNSKYRTDITVAFFAENACFRLEPRRVFSSGRV